MGKDFNYKVADCPYCGRQSKRHSVCKRDLIDFSATVTITFSKHQCKSCRKYFVNPAVHSVVSSKSIYTRSVMEKAVSLYREEKLTLDAVSLRLVDRLGVRVPPTTIHDWINREAA